MIIDFSKYKLEILLFILFFYSLIFCNLSKSRVLFIESNDEASSYFGRRPWENTLAYFPFENDSLDHWQYWVVLSNGWTKQTLWYNFQSESNFSLNLNLTRFVAVRINVKSWRWNWTWQLVCLHFGWMCYNINHWQTDFRNTIQFWNWTSWRKVNTWMTQNKRFHLAWYYDWTNAVMFVNWVKTNIVNSSSYYSQVQCESLLSWNWYSVDLSQVILEKQPRTDEELVEYVNKTKSKYWY